MIKSCDICNHSFDAYSHSNKYCGYACREKANIERINSDWMKEKIIKTDHSRNAKIEYARVSKKPTYWMKKFNACRG